jgi:hypothetical protein
MAYRYWCGECGYRTSWGSESLGAEQQSEHYARRHPGVPPGGQVEVNRKNPGKDTGTGGCCLGVLVIGFLLLVLPAACHR